MVIILFLMQPFVTLYQEQFINIYIPVYTTRFILFSSCRHPKIFLLCTKTDDVSEVLPPDVQSSILSLSASLVQKVLGYNSDVRKVSLVNEIFHTSSCVLPGGRDPRKSPQDLRDMLTALNNFNATKEMLIPNNWLTFGEQQL